MARSPRRPSPTTFRVLARTEGSLVDGLGSGQNEPTWHTVSLSGYNNWIRSGRTGAKALNLPLITVGRQQSRPDRPPASRGGRRPTPSCFSERLFSKASLRILLSDTAADMTTLPTVTGTAAVDLNCQLEDQHSEHRHAVRSDQRVTRADCPDARPGVRPR